MVQEAIEDGSGGRHAIEQLGPVSQRPVAVMIVERLSYVCRQIATVFCLEQPSELSRSAKMLDLTNTNATGALTQCC